MSKKLIPQNGYVLIKPSQEGESMVGNIILPDLGKEKPAQGIVIDMSRMENHFTGEWVYPDGLEINDEVLIPRVGSQRISIDEQEYYLCKFSEILLIIK